MTLLGKIFTVLILVMSVLFMGFAIMVYATHTNWKMLADNANPTPEFPKLGLKQEIEQLQAVNRLLRDEVERGDTELAMEQAARRSALSALQTKFDQAEVQYQAGQAQLRDQQAAHSEAVEMLRTTQNRLAQQTEEVSELRQANRDAQLDRDSQFAKVVDLTDRYNWAQGEKRLLTERQDQLADMVNRQKRVLDAHGLTENTPTDMEPPLGVYGRVIAVGDRDLIEISLGSDDGLRVGHRLDVYRDRFYLGKVVIRETQPDKAVAEVIREYRKGLIKKGDSVATKLI